jgi:ribonuclease VapC
LIVDASALIAIVKAEANARACLQALRASPVNRISAANLLEAAIVVDRFPDPATAVFDGLIQRSAIRVEPVTMAQVSIARDAYRRFGKGSGHPARLNFGDCFAYALAINLDEPLLFIGEDFIHTDVRRVLV